MNYPSSSSFSRRGFIQAGIAGAAALVGAARHACADTHASLPLTSPKWKHPFPAYVDRQTGVTVFNLTPGEQEDQVVYQTHPMWTRGMSHFLFHSNRSGTGMRPHLLEMDSGEVRSIVPDSHQRGSMTWSDNTYYYLDNHVVYARDLVQAFHRQGEPRTIGRIPESFQRYSGDVTVDADSSAFYFGAQLDASGEKYGVCAMDLHSGETRVVVETDFKVGHFQANPTRAGQLMFCWETGGDAPQRTWKIRACVRSLACVL